MLLLGALWGRRMVQGPRSDGLYTYGGACIRVGHASELAGADSRAARRGGLGNLRARLRSPDLPALPAQGPARRRRGRSHAGGPAASQPVHSPVRVPAGAGAFPRLAGYADPASCRALPETKGG